MDKHTTTTIIPATTYSELLTQARDLLSRNADVSSDDDLERAASLLRHVHDRRSLLTKVERKECDWLTRLVGLTYETKAFAAIAQLSLEYEEERRMVWRERREKVWDCIRGPSRIEGRTNWMLRQFAPLIPRKHREPIMGDLYQDVAEWRAQGDSEWLIRARLFIQLVGAQLPRLFWGAVTWLASR